VRQANSAPKVHAFKRWAEEQLNHISGKSDLAKAFRYALNRWASFCLFLEDGRVAIDNNPAERGMRPLGVGRRNWLFAGSDAGGETLARALTLIETAKMNGLDPQALSRRPAGPHLRSQDQPAARTAAMELEAAARRGQQGSRLICQILLTSLPTTITTQLSPNAHLRRCGTGAGRRRCRSAGCLSATPQASGLAPEEIIAIVVRRWQVEVTISEVGLTSGPRICSGAALPLAPPPGTARTPSPSPSPSPSPTPSPPPGASSGSTTLAAPARAGHAQNPSRPPQSHGRCTQLFGVIRKVEFRRKAPEPQLGS
jgi:hypothetical protein